MPEETAQTVLSGLLGRAPMSPAQLLKELHRADWPEVCTLSPADFLALANFFALAKDDNGMYFVVAATTVRPASHEGHLDLSDWQPDRIVLARPLSEWGK